MAPLINPDDLVDSSIVAEILNLSGRGSVAVYRKRYENFPTPIVDLGPGRPMLWLRSDIEAWSVKHPSRTAREG